MGLGPLACWEGGFESRQRHGRVSLLSVDCCKVRLISRPEKFYGV
jgi:hypothetical protein